MRRLPALATLLTLFACADASASTSIRPGGDETLPYAGWVAESAVPTPDARVWVYRDDCPSLPDYNCTNGRTIWLHPLEHRLERTFFHELGHVFDSHELNRSERVAWREASGLTGQWRINESGVRTLGLQEAFADSYADCALGAGGEICNLIGGFA